MISEVERLLADSLGKTVILTSQICAGKNSKVYRAECLCGAVFAIKFYMHPTADGCSRLEQEWAALSFMECAGIANVPKPIARNEVHQAAIYSFIDGDRVEKHTSDDIGDVLNFIGQLKAISRRNDALNLSLAAEACLSPSDLVLNIEKRYDLLKALPHSDELFEKMHLFLENKISVAFSESVERAKKMLPVQTWNVKIPFEKRSLSPSDFGFHNVLRNPLGNLFFLDFEYFGWDDPVKATSDFLLHPAMDLRPADVRVFYTGMRDLFNMDELFEIRFKAYLPLFRLKWCLIMLNEFFKEGLSRRRFASKIDDSDEDFRRSQLLKAEKFLSRDKEIMNVIFV